MPNNDSANSSFLLLLVLTFSGLFSVACHHDYLRDVVYFAHLQNNTDKTVRVSTVSFDNLSDKNGVPLIREFTLEAHQSFTVEVMRERIRARTNVPDETVKLNFDEASSQIYTFCFDNAKKVNLIQTQDKTCSDAE